MKVRDMFPPDESSDHNLAYAWALWAETDDIIWQGHDSAVHPNRKLCWDCGCYHDPRQECIFLAPKDTTPPSGPNPFVETLHDIGRRAQEEY